MHPCCTDRNGKPRQKDRKEVEIDRLDDPLLRQVRRDTLLVMQVRIDRLQREIEEKYSRVRRLKKRLLETGSELETAEKNLKDSEWALYKARKELRSVRKRSGNGC